MGLRIQFRHVVEEMRKLKRAFGSVIGGADGIKVFPAALLGHTDSFLLFGGKHFYCVRNDFGKHFGALGTAQNQHVKR